MSSSTSLWTFLQVGICDFIFVRTEATSLKSNQVKIKILISTEFFIACTIIGLEYIHANNILHRDLKPENLVFDENGYIRITDFGVARYKREDNHRETSGTPGYMAPEVMCGRTHGFAADYFAIGVMVYEFMQGERPYLGKTRREIKDAILREQAKITDLMIPRGWTRRSAEFANSLLKRKDRKRLGFNKGIQELKEHPWFSDFDWEACANKTMVSPFLPNSNTENYDHNYCEKPEKHSPDTLERYQVYLSRDDYLMKFANYTYVNESVFDEFMTSMSNTKSVSTNSTIATRQGISGSYKIKKKILNINNSNLNDKIFPMPKLNLKKLKQKSPEKSQECRLNIYQLEKSSSNGKINLDSLNQSTVRDIKVFRSSSTKKLNIKYNPLNNSGTSQIIPKTYRKIQASNSSSILPSIVSRSPSDKGKKILFLNKNVPLLNSSIHKNEVLKLHRRSSKDLFKISFKKNIIKNDVLPQTHRAYANYNMEIL